MNPWGFLIAFAGFIVMYIGIKGSQSTVVKAFKKSS